MIDPPETESTKKDVIIHVLVVGFHHKKGCMVEFAYPPLSSEDNINCGELPEPWKHLPSLALPDGAHNFEEDAIYFHLPSLENPAETVYGISCYRQMNAQKLIRKSSDITRGSVQKSVCVLSRLPLFGLIQAKLELITHAYFDERDFSQVSLLEETYRNLNSSLPKDLCDSHQVFLGLSVRDFVLRFRHKALLLFKLLLLERKVLFYKSPVKELCSVILTLCSLVPGMIETGLSESVTSLPLLNSPDNIANSCEPLDSDSSKQNNNVALRVSVANENGDGLEEDTRQNVSSTNQTQCENDLNDIVSSSNTTVTNFNLVVADRVDQNSDPVDSSTPNKVNGPAENRLSQSSSDTENDSWIKVNQLAPESGSSATSVVSTDIEMKVENAAATITATSTTDEERLFNEINRILQVDDGKDNDENETSLQVFQKDSISLIDFRIKQCNEDENSGITRDSSTTSLPLMGKSSFFDIIDNESNHGTDPDGSKVQIATDVPNVAELDSSDCGFPLAIFTKGVLCHPYLSLPFLDLLSDLNIRGFVIGATNVLFKQKKHLFDVIVEVDEGKIEILDPDLRRQLNLTTEDLRFADHLLRNVMEDKKDVFLDGTGWEGGDEWLRAQFKLYLVGALRTSLEDGTAASKEADAFSSSFMNSWKLTHNYRMWSRETHDKVMKLHPGHPFHGQLSMADMKLKLSHSMQSSEKGRRLNSAVASTGKVVLQTGKAVGKVVLSAVRNRWYHPGGPTSIPLRKKKKGASTRSKTSQ